MLAWDQTIGEKSEFGKDAHVPSTSCKTHALIRGLEDGRHDIQQGETEVGIEEIETREECVIYSIQGDLQGKSGGMRVVMSSVRKPGQQGPVL